MATYRDLNDDDAQNFLNNLETAETPQQSGAIASKEAEALIRERKQKEEVKRAQDVRRMSQAGAETVVDPVTNRKTVARHPDGAVKFTPAEMSEVVPTKTQTVARVQGQDVPTLNQNIMLGGGGELGATGASGFDTVTEYGQVRRDDRGKTFTEPVEPTKDLKTGRSYVTRKDPATGLEQKVLADVDMEEQAKLGRKMVLEDEQVKLSARENAINQERLTFDPQFKPVEDEYTKAKKEFESLPNDLQRRGDSWVKVNPETGVETLATPFEVARRQQVRADAETKLKAAEEKYTQLKPKADNLSTIETGLKQKKLDLEAQKIRIDNNLPEDDGETAKALAWDRYLRENGKEGIVSTQPEFQAVLEHIRAGGELTEDGEFYRGTLGAIEDPDQPDSTIKSSDAVAPVLPPEDPAAAERIKSTLGVIKGVEGMEVEKVTASDKGKDIGLHFLRKDGERIASISNGGNFAPIITLSMEGRARKDIQDLVNAKEIKGVPLYLTNSANRKDIIREAEEVSTIFAEAANKENFDASGKPLPRLGEKLEALGATPDKIMARVDMGELSVQNGALLLKELYGQSMEMDGKVDDPKTFQKWLAGKVKAENEELRKYSGDPTKTQKRGIAYEWKEATSGMKNFGKQDAIKREFLVDTFMENRGKLGVKFDDFYQRHKAMDSSKGQGFWDKRSSNLAGLGEGLTQVGGSMLGIYGGVLTQAAAGGLGLAGDEKAKAAFDEFNKLRGLSSKRFLTTLERNRQVWFSDKGESAMNRFEQATSNYEQFLVNDLSKPLAQQDRQKKIELEQEIAKASIDLHQLSDDKENPMTIDDVDPRKNPVLAASLARFAVTADPRMFEQFKSRLLLNKTGQELAKHMESKVTNDGFLGAMQGGMYAGWEEAAADIGTDIISVGSARLAKGAVKALKGVGTLSKSKGLERTIGAVDEAISKISDLGIQKGTLMSPLTKTQVALNTGVKIAKNEAAGATVQGAEEAFIELGAEQPQIAQAFALGALGQVLLMPVSISSTVSQINREAKGGFGRDVEMQNAKFAESYNQRNGDIKGFEPITKEIAANARQLLSVDNYEQRMKQATELLMTAKTPQEVQSVVAEMEALAPMSEAAIEAAREIETMTDPGQKTFYSGIAKVAAGNAANLTQGERLALQQAKTDNGLPYFANVNGREVITDEARAEIAMNAPMVGQIIQTTESQAILEAQAQTRQSNEQDTQGQPQTQAAPQAAPTEQAPAPSQAVGSDQPGGGTIPATGQQAQGQPSLAQLEPAEFAAAAQGNPSMPSVDQVVGQAFASGQPVSIGLADSSSVAIPADYVRQGSTLVRQTASGAVAPAIPSPAALPEAPKTNQAPDKTKPAPVRIAETVKQEVERVLPQLAGRVEILEGSGNTGGLDVNIETGNIRIYSGDIALNQDRYESEQDMVESLANLAIRHEAVHAVQVKAVRQLWEEQGSRGSFADFFKAFYADLAGDLLTPRVLRAAREIYGKDSQGNYYLDSYTDEGLKAAEVTRMLIEAKLSGDGKFSELFRAVRITGAASKLVRLIQRAVEMLKASLSAQTPQMQAHIAKLEELYTELQQPIEETSSAPTETPTGSLPDGQPSTSRDVEAPAGLRIETDGDNAKILKGDISLWQGKADQAEAQLKLMQEADGSTMQLVGQALMRAFEKYPQITAKQKEQLYDLVDELEASLEGLNPEEIIKEVERSIAEWLDSQEETKAEAAREKARNKGRNIDTPAREKAKKLANSGQFPAITAILDSGMKIAPRPNRIGLILSRKRQGKRLTNEEIRILNNDQDYNGALTQSMFDRSGDGAVAREVVSMLMARQGEGISPDEMAGYYKNGATSSELWEQLDKEVTAISRGKTAMEGDALDPNRERTDDDIEAELAERKERGEWVGDEEVALPTLSEIASQMDEVYGENTDLAAKLRIIEPMLESLPDTQRVAIQQAAVEEQQRIAAGVISAAKWQEMNPELKPFAAFFQRLLDNQTRESMKGAMNRLRSPKAQEQLAAMSLASSPTQQESDAEYLAAVESGDMESAQRMVEAAAKKAGFNAARALHGSGWKFDTFNKDEGGKVTDADSAKQAFFFTDGRSTARSYAEKAATLSEDKEIDNLLKKVERAEKVGNWDLAESLMMQAEELEYGEGAKERRAKMEKDNAVIYDVFLRGNFKKADAEGNNYLSLDKASDFSKFKGKLTPFMVNARKEGYDGVEIKNFDDALNGSEIANHWAVFSPNQIKSADPVTYDTEGNVIPLSKRFNSNSDSILFSSPSNQRSLDFGVTGDMGTRNQLGFDFSDGPRAKAKENAQAAFDKLPEGSLGRERIANDIAKREGLADPQAFIEAATKSDIERRIEEAESNGVELSERDKQEIREADQKAKEFQRKANRLSGLASDPLNKGNAFPMGVGFTTESKRSNQRIDASVRRAGEAVIEAKKAKASAEKVDQMLSGKGTEAAAKRKEASADKFERELVEKILSWKKGDVFRDYTIEKINIDRDGYPSSFNASGGGIIKGVNDKFDVVREFFGRDQAKYRRLVDEARAQAQSIDQQANEAATSPENATPEPTDAQKKAGNYKVGRVKIGGMDISIENPAGSTRSGTNDKGKRWEVTMESHYGYVRGTEGKDGDHIDIFIQQGTPENYAGPVFVVNQMNADGAFDEHKAVLGPNITTEEQAKAEYLKNYSAGWNGAGSIAKFDTVEAFEKWATERRRIAPAKTEAEIDKLKAIESNASEVIKKFTGLFVGIEGSNQTYEVGSFAEASKKYGDLRKASNAGSSQLPPAFITDADGNRIARISYNGRVWDNEGNEIDLSDKAIETAPAAKESLTLQAKPNTKEITDFGEKIGGARKDYAQTFAEAKTLDIASEPFSKVWPEPNYKKLIADGIDPFVVGFIRSMRDEVPVKPRRWGMSTYIQQVETLRGLAEGLVSGEISQDTFKEMLRSPKYENLNNSVGGRAELYQEIGHEQSLKGFRFRHTYYNLYKGEPNVWKWEITKPAKATAFGNMPMTLAEGNSREEVLAKFKALVASKDLSEKPKIKFEIYRYNNKAVFHIGKKIGRHTADLFTFDTAKEARDYLRENYDDVVARLESYKKIGEERRTENAPRIGADHLKGRDITPAMFQDAFGFRGVEFGNYVEQKRRQSDLNRAYEALMDLSGILNISPKALSLDGTLGLAFGARGSGGKNAAAAHYESGKVVINLTKNNGPGSLAHEWFHAMDNYFLRQVGKPMDFATATRGTAWGARLEVMEAFGNIIKTIDQTGLRKRSRNLDKKRSTPYWSTDIELSARAFENYVIARMQAASSSNDYLVNISDISAYAESMIEAMFEGNTAQDLYPYLTEDEVGPVVEAFDQLFDKIKTKPTEKGIALYSSPGVPRGEQQDLFTAVSKPDAKEVLGDVKTGRTHALNAYRTLTAKRAAGRTLTANEEQQLLDAETALGQKLAFDMEELRKESEPEPTETQPPVSRPRADQQDMMLGGETLKGGQITLFSSPASFYSPLQRAIEAKIPARATPEQIMATVRATNVKEDEIKWSGIEQALSSLAVDGKVSKDTLLDYLNDEGSVRFEEVTMGQSTEPSIREEKADDGTDGFALYNGDEFIDWYETREQAKANVPNLERISGGTKYAQYQLPGGDNYREVVLAMPQSLPENKWEIRYDKLTEEVKSNLKERGFDVPEGGYRVYADGKLLDGAFRSTPESAIESARKTQSVIQANYTSSHFPDVPNYVAHMRLNERTDAEGNEGLFIEEIQSDRHQEGRKKGYQDANEKLVKEKIANDTGTPIREMDSYLNSKNADKIQSHPLFEVWIKLRLESRSQTGIPDAPFRTTWPLAMFKRALRDAVASGKDWIGWTTGETQNDRFDLSKQISRVTYTKTKVLRAYDKNGDRVMNQKLTDDVQLEDYIGKEPAQRLLEQADQEILDTEMSGKPPSGKVLEGQDLKVGGSGMKGFYDNMLPKEIGKYVKQWGAKVEKSEIGQSINMEDLDMGEIDDATPEELAELRANGSVQGDAVPIWRVNITPEMASSIQSEGLALFSSPSPRAGFQNIPDALVLNDLGSAMNHPAYDAAKKGNPRAALELARALVTPESMEKIKQQIGDSKPIIVPVLAIEESGRNMIPLGVAKTLKSQLGLETTEEIIQSVKAFRGGKSALDRVFAQSAFDGEVVSGAEYLLVDDTLTQGGTFAALASHIQSKGGKVVGIVALTGKQYSAKLILSDELLNELRETFGDVENDFRKANGYGFEGLTESEARALVRFRPADAVRSRIIAEGNEKGRGLDGSGTAQSLGSSPVAKSETPDEGWTAATHFTANQFSEFDHDKAAKARDIAAYPSNAEENPDIKPGYTTAYGRDYVFPSKAHFFFLGNPPQYSPVGKPLSVHLRLDNALDLTKRIPGDVMGKIIDFVKLHANSKPSPGMAGYTAKGSALGGFREARVNGATAEQLWEFLNQNTFIARGRMWDQMLEAIGKDSVIFHGNSSGTFIGEKYRGPADGKTYTVAAVVDSSKIRITPSTATALGSSPSPEPSSEAVQEALAKMPPIYRNVFTAINDGATPEEVMKRFPQVKTTRAVENILNQVRSRIEAATQAAEGNTRPKIDADGMIEGGGRPDLALSANPRVAAIDQIRNQSGVPDVRGWEEVHAQALEELRKDYAGTYARMLEKARNLEQMSDVEVAITKRIIAQETMEGRTQTEDERVNIAMLIHGYRDIGTETARALAIRRDPEMTPAERHAQFIAEALFSPDPKTRARLRKAAPKDQKSILAGWMKRVDQIKDELKARGYDLDASLAAYQERKQEMQDAAALSPRTAEIIKDSIRKLTKREKTIVEALRPGQTTYEGAAYLTGVTKEEAKAIYTRWVAGIKTAMQESAQRYLAATLASSPANMMTNILDELGVVDPDMIAMDEADRARVNEERAKREPQKPRKQRKKKEKSADEPGAEAIAPKGTTVTPEMEAKWAEAAEKFRNAPPSTWRTLWQTEMENLRPIFGSIPFAKIEQTFGEAWKAEQIEMFPEPEPERLPINETTGTFDLNDRIAMKEVVEAFSIARATRGEKLMEYWRMSILSGPQTHVVNVGSNILHAGYRLIPRRATEATINSALNLFGMGSQESATLGEFKAMAKNLRKAASLAGRIGMNVWKTEERLFEEYATQVAKQVEFTGMGAERYAPALGGKLGKIMRSLSFRAMTTADEFIKAYAGQLETAAQAHRIAKVQEKLSGEAYEKRVEELMQPGSIAWVRSLDEVKTITFQTDIDGSDPKLLARIDQIAEVAKNARNLPWIGKPLTFFIPFIDTPTNIFKESLKITPLGLALAVIDGTRALVRKVNRGDLTKEMADKEAEKLYNRARLVEDMTNQTIGIATYFAVASLLEGDEDDDRPFITGSQSYKTTQRGERDNAYAVMPPQSIRIGSMTFSYKRWEPFATVLASMVDLAKSIEVNGGFTTESASQWIGGYKDQMKDKTFLQGISSLMEAFEDPDRFLTRIATNITTGFVLNVVRQPIRTADPMMRDSTPRGENGFFGDIARGVGYSIVPALAPVKMDVWGNPIRKNRGVLLGGSQLTDSAVRILDPSNVTVNPDIDPIDRWIFRWNQMTADSKDRIAIQPISDKLTATIPGEKRQVKIQLTPEEQAEANRRAGKTARTVLGDDWEKAPFTEENAQRIIETVRQAQSMERQSLRVRKLTDALPE